MGVGVGVSVSESESESETAETLKFEKPLLETECLRLDFQGFHLVTLALNCHVIHTWKSSLRHSISV